MVQAVGCLGEAPTPLAGCGGWVAADRPDGAVGRSAVSRGGGWGWDGDPYLNSTALALGVFIRLILVVIAIFFAGVVLRRWQSGGGKAAVRQLAVLETLHLSQRRAVYLVRAGQQVFLLGATDQSINLLGQVTTTADARPTAAQISFDQHLSIATQKTMDTPPGEE